MQNVAAAIDLFQDWASQLSMLSAAFEAWSAVLAREDEIVQLQSSNPSYPVYIAIYWRVYNENLPLKKLYEFYGVEISGGGQESRRRYTTAIKKTT